MTEKKYNITTVIAILTFIGSLVGTWRAVEIKAVGLEKEQIELNRRMNVVEENQKKISEEIKNIAIINERTITILDQHLKNK